MGTWLGQYCINVTDLDRAVAFYETLGLECTSRTDIEQAREAIVESPDRTGAQAAAGAADRRRTVPSRWARAFWKLYVNTNDIEAADQAAVDVGHTSVVAPMRLEQWPMSIAFVADPDGYQVELVQRHPWQDDDGTATLVARPVLHQRLATSTRASSYETLGLECTSRTEIPQARRGDPRAPRARAARSSSPSRRSRPARSTWAPPCGSSTSTPTTSTRRSGRPLDAGYELGEARCVWSGGR